MLINLQKKIPGKTLIYDLKITLETGIFTGCNSRKWGHRNLAKIRTVGRYENLFDKFQFYHEFGGQNYFSEIFINLLSFFIQSTRFSESGLQKYYTMLAASIFWISPMDN